MFVIPETLLYRGLIYIEVPLYYHKNFPQEGCHNHPCIQILTIDREGMVDGVIMHGT